MSQVFNEDNLRRCKGHLAIGHNRYSTTGSSHLRNAQPYLIETMHGPLGVAHNGNLTNALALRQRLLERGVGLISSSDSEVITQMLAAPPPGGEPDGPLGGAHRRRSWPGRGRLFARHPDARRRLCRARPLGLRPLCLGELNHGGRLRGRLRVVRAGAPSARSSCARCEPGEIVRLDATACTSIQGRPPAHAPACASSSTSISPGPTRCWTARSVHRVRQRLGAAAGARKRRPRPTWSSACPTRPRRRPSAIARHRASPSPRA